MKKILFVAFLIIVSSNFSLAYKAEDPQPPPKPETKIDAPVDKKQMIKAEKDRLAAAKRKFDEKVRDANRQFAQFDATCAKSRKKTPACDSLQRRLLDLKRSIHQERDKFKRRAEDIKRMEEDLSK
jgi:hypothetical protein